MKISYDPNLKIAGIAIVPWNRLGPEQYFPNYAIASLFGWDVTGSYGPKLAALVDYASELPRLNSLSTTSLLKDSAFQDVLNKELPGYDLLTYRPVKVPESLKGRKVLMTDASFTARFENKAAFRELFASKLPFPDFEILDRAELLPTKASFQAVIGEAPKIIQDEQLSGGKGSFAVRGFEDYRRAIESLGQISRSKRVVVSSLVEDARERSIQACVTKEGIFTGPLQRQIVGHPALANQAIAGGDKFCGAQILAADQGTDTYQRAQEVAQQIGKVLASEGYKGIFGVDFLLGQDDELYVLEVNPRLTGVTPLLSALYKNEEGIPFYLLHILELGGYQYEILDHNTPLSQNGALLQLHALESWSARVSNMPASGTYTIRNEELVPVSQNIDLNKINKGEFIIQDYRATGSVIAPGSRLATLQFREQILDENTDELYNSTIEVITAVRQHIVLQASTDNNQQEQR